MVSSSSLRIFAFHASTKAMVAGVLRKKTMPVLNATCAHPQYSELQISSAGASMQSVDTSTCSAVRRLR
eukprot:6077842-Pyramimonas_sp.AAC.1